MTSGRLVFDGWHIHKNSWEEKTAPSFVLLEKESRDWSSILTSLLPRWRLPARPAGRTFSDHSLA